MFLEAEDDDMAVGRYLRIKVRPDICKPLMRGVMVYGKEDDKPFWCPLEYEFLSDFCFTCGLIGHTDKFCTIQVQKGEV